MTEATMPSDAARYTAHYLAASRAAMDAFAADPEATRVMLAMAEAVVASMKSGGKLLVAGNGGSAADAQHIAGEFISRLMFDHPALPSVALTTDSSAITATANDYGYEHVFARQIVGLGRAGDVFLGISTSGNSPNVVRALETARAQGLVTLGFAGAAGGKMVALCDHVLRAPSTWTPVIQQCHITAAHIVCALVERGMFPDLAPKIEDK
jgi:D-sedoheptulose 7-phosphate isomerase